MQGENTLMSSSEKKVVSAKDEGMAVKQMKGRTTHRYINRELSWLAFNERVLSECGNNRHPLLERLRFLSISANNLDEFHMVRVAGLKAQVAAGITDLSQDGLTPAQQLTSVEHSSTELRHKQSDAWKRLHVELQGEGISVVSVEALLESDRDWLETYFRKYIFPVLTPLAIDPAHPFPFVPNLGFAMALRLTRKRDGDFHRAHVPLPSQVERFIRLPGLEDRYVTLETCVSICIHQLFPEFEINGMGLFRVIRDSEIEFEDDAEDLVLSFEAALRERRRGNVVRLELSVEMPGELKALVINELNAKDRDVVEVHGLLGLHQLTELIVAEREDLIFPPHSARFPERIREFGDNCFAAIRAKDIIVHHPYESFDVVVQFLEQAAADPQVVAIKQTLYRTTPDSPIVKALVSAAEAGKSVTALIELKARFDEAANLQLSRVMERVGIQVVYGFMSLKTHAKVSYVVRKEDGVLTKYTHFGTGNYHPLTAMIYTDLSFFTCDPALSNDAALVFNFLTGYGEPPKFAKLTFAPSSLRSDIMRLIEGEIAHAEAGRPASIWAKMNSLVDVAVIDALYRASSCGVQVDLIVRGVCCIYAGVPGLSDNIRVKSILGRFLEHARIWAFGNGGSLPRKDAKVYMSSADWMQRNFDRRCEVMVPIENPTVHEQVLGQILLANLKDEVQSWYMQPDGTYTRALGGKDAFCAHEYFMTNPSLSGRGSALERYEFSYGGPAQLRITGAKEL